MKVAEYAALDAVALAALVRRRELHPAEITEAAIAAIETLDPTLNALVLTDVARARAQSRTVDPDLPLAGVPFLIKDVDVYTEEWPTTNSSRFFAGATPRADSEIVRRWRRAAIPGISAARSAARAAARRRPSRAAWSRSRMAPMSAARSGYRRPAAACSA